MLHCDSLIKIGWNSPPPHPGIIIHVLILNLLGITILKFSLPPQKLMKINLCNVKWAESCLNPILSTQLPVSNWTDHTICGSAKAQLIICSLSVPFYIPFCTIFYTILYLLYHFLYHSVHSARVWLHNTTHHLHFLYF